MAWRAAAPASGKDGSWFCQQISLYFSADSCTFVFSIERAVKISGKLPRLEVRCVAVAPGGGLVASGGADRALRFADPRAVRRAAGFDDYVNMVLEDVTE